MRSKLRLYNEVTGFFNSPNLSSRTMTLGSAQPLTEMSTRYLHTAKRRSARKADFDKIFASLMRRPPFTPRKIPSTHFYLWLSRPRVVAGSNTSTVALRVLGGEEEGTQCLKV
jgi:hypothetical protein